MTVHDLVTLRSQRVVRQVSLHRLRRQLIGHASRQALLCMLLILLTMLHRRLKGLMDALGRVRSGMMTVSIRQIV